MISDVPIGVFLSGGIDSSLIASIMKNYSSDKINTFTISSNNINFDESKRAKEISKYLGSSHHSLEVTKKDQLDIVDDLSNGRKTKNFSLKHYQERYSIYKSEKFKVKTYNVELKG